MTKYKVKWKDVYLSIVRALLLRGGGSGVGHHTLNVDEIARKTKQYDRDIIMEGIKRLVEKGDLSLWPRYSEELTYDSSISINLKHFDYLDKYLKGHPELYRRLQEVKEEIRYRKKKDLQSI